MIKEIKWNEIPGFKTGHAQNMNAATGCTVIICAEGAVTGVDVRGGAPGTRETDLLDPMTLVDKIHAVFLAGGSAFGLDAAAGIMQYLEDQNVGFDVQVARVPIVSGAVLFDLVVGDSRVRPDRDMGYQACLDSVNNRDIQGNIGAGTGASVGKILGMDHAMKSGLGTYAIQVGDLKIGAMVAVNCLGDVIDPVTGVKLAGVLNPEKTAPADTEAIMISAWADKKNRFSGNTTIGAVVTNASFSKAQVNKLASMTHNAYARTLCPAHSMFDGDTVFAMSCGTVEADLSVAGLLATRVMERAIINAIVNATSLCGLPCCSGLCV